MSKRIGVGHEYFNMFRNSRLMEDNESMVDLIYGRHTTQFDYVFNSMRYGLDYNDHLNVYYEDDEDNYNDDDDDEEEYGIKNNRYCGFSQNFLQKGVSKQLTGITHYKKFSGITPEEAAKNAKELVAAEEKLKKKTEKKKQKKMRQRERRRHEKLEKESGNKVSIKQDDSVPAAVPVTAPVKPKPKESECENMKKTNNPVPPDPGPQSNSVATESNDSCADDDDDDDDDNESLADDLELDMSSCFVTNAAAIAKRKLEQKPKSDKKDKKPESSKKHDTTQKSTAKPQNKNVNEKEASEEPDNVTKSMELAVIGNSYAQVGNLDMAVKYFTDAIKHNPQEFKLFGNRSFCYEKMQQYEKALIDADIALSLNHTWIKGLYRKGKALVGLKRYYEAGLTYKEVLKIDCSCTDAAQELMRVQIMQLMDMGYSREQSSNALIIHGTVEKALEALSGLHGNMSAAQVPVEEARVCPEKSLKPAKVPFRPVPQNQPQVPATLELFPIWVGDLVPSIKGDEVYKLFIKFGPIHSIRLLSGSRCAFVNYTNRRSCENAIKEMHGIRIAGTCLLVRYPENRHEHLGVSKSAATDTGKVVKYPDECHFWRTKGCIYSNRCTFKHVPENKGIDLPKVT